MIVAVCQQFAGLAIISTYNTYFFALVGMDDPFLCTLILSCVGLLAISLWGLTVDRLGRRLIVNICETLVVIICFTVGALYWTGATTGNKAAGTALVSLEQPTPSSILTIQLVICCVWQFTYQSVGMCYYLYSAELPSAILRGKLEFARQSQGMLTILVKTGPVTFFANSVTGIATV